MNNHIECIGCRALKSDLNWFVKELDSVQKQHTQALRRIAKLQELIDDALDIDNGSQSTNEYLSRVSNLIKKAKALTTDDEGEE